MSAQWLNSIGCIKCIFYEASGTQSYAQPAALAVESALLEEGSSQHDVDLVDPEMREEEVRICNLSCETFNHC